MMLTVSSGNAERCPTCRAGALRTLRTADELSGDAAWTAGFFTSALPGVSGGMLKDTAVFTRSRRAYLIYCQKCGTVMRRELEPYSREEVLYRDDAYDDELLDDMRRRFLKAYEGDRDWLMGLPLEPGARVLEVGSYVGAFLEFARQAGWRAVGIDPGRQIVDYARRLGGEVLHAPFSATAVRRELEDVRFDAVWILNCFEQLPNLASALRDVRELLKPHGLLVIRTPSGDFVRLLYRLRAQRLARTLMAGTNLGGVPYARCLTKRSLESLLLAHDFTDIAVRGHEPSSLAATAFRQTWLRSGRARKLLYAGSTAATGRYCHPWMYATARRDNRHGHSH
jgi:2-polyprenyl-3-methyl-5-hydroxy-6-metoxy-1,4-benzoquinol methylase